MHIDTWFGAGVWEVWGGGGGGGGVVFDARGRVWGVIENSCAPTRNTEWRHATLVWSYGVEARYQNNKKDALCAFMVLVFFVAPSWAAQSSAADGMGSHTAYAACTPLLVFRSIEKDDGFALSHFEIPTMKLLEMGSVV